MALGAGLFLLLLVFYAGPGKQAVIAEADLNRNGLVEIYSLKKSSLAVREGDKVVWESPGDWKVEDFIIADINNNGIDELVITAWVRGSFGQHRPFWVANDDNELWNHLYVFMLEGDGTKPVWMSSGLERPILEIEAKVANGGGACELIITESQFRRLPYCLRWIPFGREKSLWQWDGWGFSRMVVKSSAGNKAQVSKIGSRC